MPGPAAQSAFGAAGWSFADVPVHAPPSVAISRSGLPDPLRAGIERLSGLAMNDVRVHRDSPEPARLDALAFTKGSEIHLGPGQEEHLPHEAWHVVQQKQGRAHANHQWNGLAVNEDRTLEAEADLMGNRAGLAQAIMTPTHLESTHKAQPIVQRRVISAGKTLEVEKPEYSAVTNKFIRDPKLYQMRDKYCPEDPVIEIIDVTKKYLLGEEHGSGKWEKDTDFWSVNKMTEREDIIPHEPSDKENLFVETVDPYEQPLEGAHSYLLRTTLDVLVLINDLPAIVEEKDIGPKTHFVWSVDYILTELKQIHISYVNHYEDFITKYKKSYQPGQLAKGEPESIRLKSIYRLALDLKANLEGDIGDMIKKAQALQDCVVNEVILSTHHIPADVLKIQDKIKDLRSISVASLLDLVYELSGLVPSAYEGQEKKVTSLLSPSAQDFGEMVDIVDPIREADMVKHIKEADAPLLVQIGNKHLQKVADGVGRDVAYAVDMKIWLSDEAREPKGAKEEPKATPSEVKQK